MQRYAAPVVESILALIAVASACYCAWATLPLRARVAQLELERPRFVKEMEGLVAECEESLERADAKRKRADNSLRAAAALTHPEQQPSAPVVPIRGSYLERLPG